ncbi:conserved hypothetical protein [Nostocoides japonicum T1-X7]|uniref:Nudix hydrolase domain-containing protein n=1 Tax=Nostocoides japonicum T1-X7 TaxID=1194083 RepID=A0A077LT09_9MICO|nr:NUDIX domain-containing protein [Tetrasphaera japonica]CCH76453.1 conserved hypothetical protein [Tetrasphaera japonica T1-X7]
MTAANPAVLVEGLLGGSPVVALELAHGEPPALALARAGWRAERALSAVSLPGPEWRVLVRYAVAPADPVDLPAEPTVRRDAGLGEVDVAGAVVRRRVAAYALVSSARGLLLTELSARTNVAGRWNLPGGGLDPCEQVEDALRREVWEESDQEIEGVAFREVVSDHWVGRAPHGVVEDYHAVRLIHTARCPDPTDPVIHDVGGSTSDVRWFGWDEVGQVPLADSVAPLIRDAVRRHLA